MIGGGLLIDSTVVSTAGYRAFVPFVLITPNHELWIKIRKSGGQRTTAPPSFLRVFLYFTFFDILLKFI